MASALRRLEIVQPPKPPRPARTTRERPWEVWFAVGAVVVAGLLALATTGSERRVFTRMDPSERAALFERTRANVAVLCRGDPALRDACRDEAQLLLQLPECDGACQAAVAAARPAPTR